MWRNLFRLSKRQKGSAAVVKGSKLINYSNLPLSKELIHRLKVPLCSRGEPITKPTISEDVLLPLFLKPNQLLPQTSSNTMIEENNYVKCKNIEYIIHDDLLQHNHQFSFLVPLVNYLFYDTHQFGFNSNDSKVIIVTPTKELVDIIYDSCISLLPKKDDIQKVLAMTKTHPYFKEFNRSKIIIIPSERLKHIENSSEYNFDNVKIMLLHHGDTILQEDNMDKTLQTIKSKLIPYHSSLIFVQKLTVPLLNFAKENLPKRWWINLKKSSTDIQPVEDIQFNSILVDEADRFTCLKKIININHKDRTLVFLNSVELLEELAIHLHEQGYNIEIFHSELDIGDRKRRFGSFVQGYSDILLCTDSILQENDIYGCSLCIQYRLPLKSLGTVLHRSWKMGSKRDINSNCKSFILHFPEDSKNLDILKEKYNMNIKQKSHPTDKENIDAITNKTVQNISKVHQKLGSHFEKAAEKLGKEIGEKEALQRALYLLSKIDTPSKNEFSLLSKAKRARLARKDKMERIEKYVAKKKQTAKKLKQIQHSINYQEKE